MTFLGVLVTIKRMTISIESQNANSELFREKVILRITSILWLPSSNVLQVKMLPQRPVPTNPTVFHTCDMKEQGWIAAKSVFSPKVQPHPEGGELPITKQSVLEENTFKRKKKSLANSPALKAPDSGQWGSLVGLGHIWCLLCPWKRHFISLDSQRWLPAKEASEKTTHMWKMLKCIHLKMGKKSEMSKNRDLLNKVWYLYLIEYHLAIKHCYRKKFFIFFI